MEHGERVARMRPQSVKQPVEPCAVFTVFFGGSCACFTHHSDVGACAEVLSKTVQHENSKARSVRILHGSGSPSAPSCAPVQHVAEFGNHWHVQCVEHVLTGKPNAKNRPVDLKMEVVAGWKVQCLHLNWNFNFSIGLHAEDSKPLVRLWPVSRSGQAKPQHVSRVPWVDHPIVPEPRR